MNEIEKSEVSVGKAAYGVVAFAVLGLLLNGVAMKREAEALEFGAWRDYMIAVTKPIAAVSMFTHADGVRTYVADTVGAWLNKKKEGGV